MSLPRRRSVVTVNDDDEENSLPSQDQLPAHVRGLERPVTDGWWAITENKWNELLRAAAGPARNTAEKRKRNSAVACLKKYSDGHAIMTSDVGSVAPRGHCSACYDEKNMEARRECRVFANPKEDQSLACVYCRLNNRGGCDAREIQKEAEQEVQQEDPQAIIKALETRVSALEQQIANINDIAIAIAAAVTPFGLLSAAQGAQSP